MSDSQKESLYKKLFDLMDKKIKRYSYQYRTRVADVEDLENVCKMAIIESIDKFEEPETPLKEECDIEYYVKHYFSLITKNAAQTEFYKTNCAVKLNKAAYNKLKERESLPYSIQDDEVLIGTQENSEMSLENKQILEYCLKDIINTYGLKACEEFKRYVCKPYSVYKTKRVSKIMEAIKNKKLGE